MGCSGASPRDGPATGPGRPVQKYHCRSKTYGGGGGGGGGGVGRSVRVRLATCSFVSVTN